MSKYIRIEEGIFEAPHKIKENGISGYYITRKNNFGGIDFRFAVESEIIKESDNIEDLCDCLVEACISGNRVFDIEVIKTLSFKAEFKRVMNIDFNENIKVFYGAIWTDKGLIYVAKMNADEEWELI